MTKKTFLDYDLDPRLCEALAEDGITEPFPIQELTLPVAIEGHDVIGQARTGSGKTFGFGLPALHRIDEARREVQVLVVTPTRELCVQVTEDFEQAARKTDIKILSVYGGVPIEPQTDTLKAGVHVVVGTPGRLLDHVRRRNLDLSTCQTLILDEADEMLDMGFLPDVEQLIAKCHEERHTMLFSATMPTAVVSLARRYMDRPTFIRAEVEQHTIPDRMEQHFFLVHKLDKPRVLARILQTPERGLAVVFTRTKAMADRLVEDLVNYEISAVAIHGDLRQATREKNLDKFKSETSRQDVLVATEVAARGLDIDDVTHVINYDPPEDEKMYLHRIGRTARAGQKGVAITFATFAEIDRLNAIRKELDLTREPIEETFSTSDTLTRTFDLPQQTPWGHLSSKSRTERERSNDRTKNDRSKNDRSKNDRTKNDRSKNDRSKDDRGTNDRTKNDRGTNEPSRGDRSKNDRPRKAAPPVQDQVAEARPAEGGDEAPASMDGSTPKRSRTRTRTTETSSTRRSTSRDSTSPDGDTPKGSDGKSASSSSGSGRTRARARRSDGGTADRSTSAEDSARSSDDAGGDTSSRGSSSRGSSSSRSRSSSSKGGKSSSRSGGNSSKGGNASRGGSDPRGSGRTRSDSRDSGNDRGRDETAPATTAPGDDARGDADPGIVRRVKVEHLP